MKQCSKIFSDVLIAITLVSYTGAVILPVQHRILSIEQARPSNIIVDFGNNPQSQAPSLIVNRIEALVDPKLVEAKDFLAPPPRMLQKAFLTNSEEGLADYKMLIEKFHSLGKPQTEKICKSRGFTTYKPFMPELEEYSPDDVKNFFQQLCSQIGAGVEIEVKIFPCGFDERDLMPVKNINGKKIRHCFTDGSELMLGFNSNSERVLGYDVTSHYYIRVDDNNKKVNDWQAVKRLLKNYDPDNWDNRERKNQPDMNYEFRTIGKLDKNSFSEAVTAFETWYERIVHAHTTYKPSNTETNLPFFMYRDQAICIPELGDILDKNKNPLSSVPQLTVSFDISQLSTVVNLLSTDGNLYNGEDHDITTNLNNFFSRQPIFPNKNDWDDDLKYINSGMIYLNELNWGIINSIKPDLSERYKNELNFLLMIGSFWFKEEKGYDKAIARFREENTNNYLKGCSPFLPRMNERLIVSEGLIKAILENVTPFFDIYLPFEVRISYGDLPESPTLVERINKLTKIYRHWAKKKLDQNQQKSLEAMGDYIALLNEYFNAATSLKRRTDIPVFKYSFSLYLVDLLMFPLNKASKRLVINHYYVYGNTKNAGDLKELIPTSEVEGQLPTTLVLEFRDMGERLGIFPGAFENFIENFYQLSSRE